MGCDKALLAWNSRALVEDVAEKVEAAAGSVALIGHCERYRRLPLACLPDLRPGLGPLAGIETALRSRRADLNLILACDMPGIETAFLQHLLQRAHETDARCVVSRDVNGFIHPLCAVYRRDCLAKISAALDERRLKLVDIAIQLGASTVDFGSAMWNINTPEQWAQWRDATDLGTVASRATS